MMTPFFVPQEAALLRVLDEITRTFDRSGEFIWSENFRPDQMPVLFLGSDVVRTPWFWSVNLELPHAPLAELEVAPGLVLQRHQAFEIERPVTGFHVGSEINEQICVVFDLDGPLPLVSDPEFARLVVHELFHYYQVFISCWKTPVGYDSHASVVPLGVDRVLGDLEVELLEQAVDADDDEFELLVTRFCETRRHRDANQERPRIVSQERGLEQIEGTARYVENRYAEFNGRPARLELPPEALSDDIDWHNAGRFYRTGARMGEILDRLGIDWRPRLQIGQTPALIVAEVMAARSPRVVDVRTEAVIDVTAAPSQTI